jgi:hypothetical protein
MWARPGAVVGSGLVADVSQKSLSTVLNSRESAADGPEMSRAGQAG